MKISKYILSVIAALLALPAFAADVNTETEIFDPLFRTLTVTRDDDMMLTPVIDLNGRSHLTISFDEITDDRSYLRCRLLHCNADWQPSMLQENEYVSGFNYMDIEDYAYSSNTFIHFVNYRVTIPNEEMAPLRSGNYLMQIFDRDEPEKNLLQVRFKVSEETAFTGGSASARTDRGLNESWQQVNLFVEPGQAQIRNPYTDVLLIVEQNGRPDTRRVIDHPMRVQGTKIIYEHEPRLIFPAGNEYRRFETVRNNYPGMGVDSTGYFDPMYHAWLHPDAEREDRNYVYDRTQRGRFKIDEYNSTDPDLGADYIMTHFTLDFPEVIDGDIYVDGALFLNRHGERNRMKYDRQTATYRLDVPLKQGSYNYQYVIKGRGDGQKADPSLIEGNKYETVNEYNVEVWIREPGARADRLISTTTLTTE